MFVLIVILVATFSNGQLVNSGSVMMETFTTKAKCEAAVTYLRNYDPVATAVCIEQ